MWKMLETPGNHFDVIKKCYPHYYHFTAKTGQTVYWEKVSKIDLKGLKDSGCVLDDLVRHYMLNAEFFWTYVCPEDDATSVTILDVEGISFSQLTGDVMAYIKAANAFYGKHFPEKAYKIFIINVPMMFSAIWKMVSMFVDPVTVQKIKILRGKSTVLKELAEVIDMKYIPKEYGGTCEVPLGEAPQEKALFELQRQLKLRVEEDNSKAEAAASAELESEMPAEAPPAEPVTFSEGEPGAPKGEE